MIRLLSSICIVTPCLVLEVQASEWSGFIASELRYFPYSPPFSRQYEDVNLSLALQPEFRHQWDDDHQIFTFVPFLRLDQHDPERTHVDIRELTWSKAEQNWELRVGIRKLFWGVTESSHLVDIINQTDLVEDPEGKEKLGQPMLNVTLWGNLDLFLLPGLRERTFPGQKGRLLYNGMPVDTDHTRYESSAQEKHTDWAVRWSRTLGSWDIGLSHFVGTHREPHLLLTIDEQNQWILIPYYDQIEQTGLDLQITQKEWLWKLETISRKEQKNRFTALTGGLEYTFVGVLDSATDIGVLAEYLFDDRHDHATTPFENDIMLGIRLTLNDVQSTELLATTLFDLDDNSHFYNFEANRRFGDNWKLSLKMRAYSKAFKYDFNHEGYLQVELARYF